MRFMHKENHDISGYEHYNVDQVPQYDLN